jgi:hypothetical protein
MAEERIATRFAPGRLSAAIVKMMFLLPVAKLMRISGLTRIDQNGCDEHLNSGSGKFQSSASVTPFSSEASDEQL